MSQQGMPTRKRKRALEPPSTEQASRRAPSLQVPTEASAQAEADVLKYFERFRRVNERNGTNARGGGSQTITDAEILTNLCSFLELLDDLKKKVGEGDCKKLHEFLVAYGVVRTFPGVAKDKLLRLKPIVEHLRSRKAALTRGFDFVHEVDNLVAACQAAGFNKNVSFASKCLCMLGHPVPIYSSEAVAYLKHAGHAVTTAVAYDTFQRAWFEQYAREGAPFKAAASKHLASGKNDEASCGGVRNVNELERRLGAEWFAMRGFDVKMMAVGAPLRKK